MPSLLNRLPGTAGTSMELVSSKPNFTHAAIDNLDNSTFYPMLGDVFNAFAWAE